MTTGFAPTGQGGTHFAAAPACRFVQPRPDGGPNGLGWGVVDSVVGRRGPALTHAGEDIGGDKAGKAVIQAELSSLTPAK